MKKVIICSCLIIISSFMCRADMVVIFDETTREVYTVSDKDDTVVPSGMGKEILAGSVKDYKFSESATNYKYVKEGKFIKNLDKIEAEYRKIEKIKKDLEQEKKIQAKMRELAIKALEEE